MMTRDDETLRALYARLLEHRPRDHSAGGVEVETIQSLAEGRYIGVDREVLLDQVLADPAMSAEFRFFRDLAREAPRSSGFRLPRMARMLALAASAILTISLGARLLREEPDADPVRGEAAAVVVALPLARVNAGAVEFAWHPVAGAVSYDLEVARDDGAALVTATTADTSYTATLEASASTLRWWVSARRDDGSSVRSDVRALSIR